MGDLIDSYVQECISREEFELRMKTMKQELKMIKEGRKRVFDPKKSKQELTLVEADLEDFSFDVASSLDGADWLTKRDIIGKLVKRIEISLEEVNVMFYVKFGSISPSLCIFCSSPVGERVRCIGR